MPAVFVVELELHKVTDITTGVWCERCLLPSAITAGFALVHAATLHTVKRFDVTVCERCDT